MSELGIVGSLIASHRAKHSHPDRRNFIPQARRLPRAAQVSASATSQQSGQSDAKKATGVKAADAADAYEHILTIQNAADLEFPANNPANAPARAKFKLGSFPPDHHVTPAAPTPTPTFPRLQQNENG